MVEMMPPTGQMQTATAMCIAAEDKQMWFVRYKFTQMHIGRKFRQCFLNVYAQCFFKILVCHYYIVVKNYSWWYYIFVTSAITQNSWSKFCLQLYFFVVCSL
jgi:hypothetical protein